MGGQPLIGQKEYNDKYRNENGAAIASQRSEYRKTDKYKQWLERTKKERSKKVSLRSLERKESSVEWWLINLLKSAKTRKSKNGVPKKCTLTLDDLIRLYEKQNGLCAISNLQMDFKSGSLYSISIDRIDNSIGYDKDNIQLTCRWANIGRGTASLEEMKKVVLAIRSETVLTTCTSS